MSEETPETVESLQAALAEKSAMLEDVTKQFEAVKSKADELLDETKKAKARAREEAEAKDRAEKEKAQKNGDFEQLLKSSEKERESIARELESLRDSVGSERQRNVAMKLAAELADGSNAELLSEFISKRLKYTEEGVKVLDQSGNLTVSSIDDLKREFEASDRFKSLLRGSRSNGGGAVGDGGRASSAKEIKRAEFDKMEPAAKAAYFKDGGKLID